MSWTHSSPLATALHTGNQHTGIITALSKLGNKPDHALPTAPCCAAPKAIAEHRRNLAAKPAAAFEVFTQSVFADGALPAENRQLSCRRGVTDFFTSIKKGLHSNMYMCIFQQVSFWQSIFGNLFKNVSHGHRRRIRVRDCVGALAASHSARVKFAAWLAIAVRAEIPPVAKCCTCTPLQSEFFNKSTPCGMLNNSAAIDRGSISTEPPEFRRIALNLDGS